MDNEPQHEYPSLHTGQSEIWFQYLVNYIIHTRNTYDNRYTVIYLIFMISFYCESNTISFEDN